MKGTIKLKNPIMIDGKPVSEVTYDSNEITALLYAEADAKKKVAAGLKNVSISPAVEFDFGLHLYMGFAAVIAINPGYSFEDLERIKGMDVMEFTTIGRDFLLKSDSSEENNSEEESDNTAKPTTPASQTSSESE